MAVRATPTSSIIVSEHDSTSDVSEPITWEEQSAILSAEVQAQLLLGALGGSEIIKISRHDRVQGEQTFYQPISNANSWAAQHTAKSALNYVATLKSNQQNFSLNISDYYSEDAELGYPESVEVDVKSNAFSANETSEKSVRINTILELDASNADYSASNSLSSFYGDEGIPVVENTYAYNVPKGIVGVLG